MPTLKQVHNYTNHRRSLISDNNLSYIVEQIVDANVFMDGLDENRMFLYGKQMGIGTDDDHFQVSFTSIALLTRISSANMFHLDGTYKIIKYFYPVIVFGCSDISHEFYPIALSITSHETMVDYLHFLNELKKLVEKCCMLNLSQNT